MPMKLLTTRCEVNLLSNNLKGLNSKCCALHSPDCRCSALHSPDVVGGICQPIPQSNHALPRFPSWPPRPQLTATEIEMKPKMGQKLIYQTGVFDISIFGTKIDPKVTPERLQNCLQMDLSGPRWLSP